MTSNPYLIPGRTDWNSPWQVLADSARTGGVIILGEARIPAKTPGPNLHVHSREDELGYVVEGVFTFQVGDQVFDAKAGDAVWLPRDVPHTFANRSSEFVRVLGAVVPGGLEGMFREQAEYFASLDGPPDEDVVAEIGARYGVTRVGPPLDVAGS